jgi:hypothetical protein
LPRKLELRSRVRVRLAGARASTGIYSLAQRHPAGWGHDRCAWAINLACTMHSNCCRSGLDWASFRHESRLKPRRNPSDFLHLRLGRISDQEHPQPARSRRHLDTCSIVRSLNPRSDMLPCTATASRDPNINRHRTFLRGPPSVSPRTHGTYPTAVP